MLPASLFVAPCLAGAVEPLRVCRRPQLVWGFHCQAFPCSNPQCFHPFVRSAGLSDPHPVLRRPVRRRYPAHGSGGRAARWRPRKRRTLVEVRNQADSAIYTAGKPLQGHGSRGDRCGAQACGRRPEGPCAAVGSKDVERIRLRIGMVSQALTRFGEAIHSAAATTGTRSAAEQSVASNAGAAGPSVAGATVSSTPSSRK
jgi:hypothetical protein